MVSVVPRIDILMELTAMFNDSTATRTPTVAIICGTTGFGKSAIVADFCRLNRHLYEHITWVDSREPVLVEARMRDDPQRVRVGGRRLWGTARCVVGLNKLHAFRPSTRVQSRSYMSNIRLLVTPISALGLGSIHELD